jgi:hypothetical protein
MDRVHEHSNSPVQYHNQNSSEMILTTQLAYVILYAVISHSFITFVPRYSCLVPRVYCLARSDESLKKILMRTVCYLTFHENINTLTPANTIHFARSAWSKSVNGHIGQDRCLYACCMQNMNGRQLALEVAHCHMVSASQRCNFMLVDFMYRVRTKSFPDYKYLLQENCVEYRHIFFLSLLNTLRTAGVI